MNIILIIIEMIISLTFLFVIFKKDNHDNLYLYCLITYLLSIFTSIKNIEIMTVEIPIGIILTAGIYIASNILVQDKGIEATKKLIKVLFVGLVGVISIALLTYSMTSFDNTVVTNTYTYMFVSKIRTILALAIIPFIIIMINSDIYYQLKREKNNIIISNLISSLIIYFIDATLFGFVIFFQVIPTSEIFITIAVIYVTKLLFSLLSIPLVYKKRNTILSSRRKKNENKKTRISKR